MRSAPARLLAVLGLLLGMAGSCLAQSPPFPQTIHDNTVVGRLGSGTGSGPAQAIPFATLGPLLFNSVQSGIDQNILNTQVVGYSITTSDCGKTVQAGTGSTGFFTVTLPSVSGFPTTCSVLIKNGDTARGKGLSGFPTDLNNVLWPQQSVGVKIVNGAWASFYQPGRYNITGATTLFFDPINGSDNNDCLASGSAACATLTHIGVIYSQQWLVNGALTVQWPTTAATYNNAANSDYFDVPPYIGSGSVVLLGNNGTPDNVHIQMSTVANAVFSFNYTGGTYTIKGFKIDSSVGSGNGNGIFVQGSTHVFYGNIDFGAFVGGFMVSGEFGAQIVTSANNTISGSAAAYLLCQDGAVCHDTAFTDTITGTPAFSTAFAWAHGPGAVVGVLAATFSGSATGTKCEADAGGYVDVDTPASLPGNSACVFTNTGTVANGGVGLNLATLSGLTTASGQLISTTGLPTIASGACGSSTNGAVVSGSTNQSGQITIGSAATTSCTLSWSATLSVAPNMCVFFPMNAAAAATGTTVARVGAPSTSSVVLTGSALANANYGYVCL